MKKMFALLALYVSVSRLGTAQQSSTAGIQPGVSSSPAVAGSSTLTTQPMVSKVIVKLVVDKTGNPSHVRVVHGVSEALDEKAIEAVRKSHFKPATKDGQPVAVDLVIEVKFEIYPNGVVVPKL